MRATTIIHAHPDTFRLLSKDCYRFRGTRTGLFARLEAAYLVFCGKADALSWAERPGGGERTLGAALIDCAKMIGIDE